MQREKKVFLVTIDTEADDQWSEVGRRTLSIDNIEELPKLQNLFERHSIVPTYLVSYPVAKDDRASGFMREFVKKKSCEIGAHLHSWDTPPYRELDVKNAVPNTELPDSLFREKILRLRDLLESRFQKQVTSYRAGRWGIAKSHFLILERAGFLVDTSLRFDYTNQNRRFQLHRHNMRAPFYPVDGCQILEVAPTILIDTRLPLLNKISFFYQYKIFSLLVKKLGFNKFKWLRPHYSSFEELKTITLKTESKYLNMMFHSSEIIPDGSPYYSGWDEIKVFYAGLEKFFSFLNRTYEIISMGLSDYAAEWLCKLDEKGKK